MISDEGIVDLTNSDEEEEEMEASTSTEEGNEQQIESDQAMAWRLMQEEAEGLNTNSTIEQSTSGRRRSERLSQNSNSPGTSGQVWLRKWQ